MRAPLRQCCGCGKTVRSWTKTVMCCDKPMGEPPVAKALDEEEDLS